MNELFSTPDLTDFPQSMHLAMIKDAIRMEAFSKAIKQTVSKGDTVLDVGSGTGILSILAARAGAKKVYSVEKSSIAEYTKKVVKDNGLDDIVEVLHHDIFSPALPSIRADVVISELLGTFGIGENVLRILNHVRENFTTPETRMIPENVSLWMAPIQCLTDYRAISDWKRKVMNIDFGAIQDLAYNAVYHLDTNNTVLLSDPCMMKSFEFSGNAPLEFTEQLQFQIGKDGVLHGVAGWFSSRLSDGVEIENSPDSTPTHWGQVMFPTGQPALVRPGDSVSFKFAEIKNPGARIWSWEGHLYDCASEANVHHFRYRAERAR